MAVTRVGTTTNLATVTDVFYLDEAAELETLANGHIAFAFATGSPNATQTSEIGTLRAMTLDAFGGIVSAALVIQGPAEAYLSEIDISPSVGTTANYFLTWNNEGSAVFTGDGYGSVRSATSAQLSAPAILSSAPADLEFSPASTRIGNGNYLATWSDSLGSTFDANLDLTVRAQLFSATGARIGSEFTLETTTTGLHVDNKAMRMTDGRELVTWGSGTLMLTGGQPSGLNLTSIRGRFVDAGGTPLGTDFLLDNVTAGRSYSERAYQIANISGGGFVVVWAESDKDNAAVATTNKTFSLRFQRFDGNGAAVGAETTIHNYTGINTTTLNDNDFISSIQIEEMANGGFAVMWRASQSPGFGSQSYLAVYNSTGGVTVAEANLSTLPGLGNLGDILSIEALPNNQLLLGGAVNSGGTITYTSQVLDLGISGFNIVNGSPTNDTALNGTANNDYISGMAGNDTISGLLGNDTLTGGLGDDTLAGGSGIDKTYGGVGNDRHIVDNALDVVVETAGQGTNDFVYTTVSYTLAAGQEIEGFTASPLAGTNPVNLTGNELKQVIRGNNGINTILGGGGNDSLYGFGGNDTIESQAGNDALFGGTGVDRFQFRQSQLGAASGIDRIYDFSASDYIKIDTASVLSERALLSTEFAAGTAALDASDRVIYDQTSGAVWFDADGTGAQAKILFAVLDTKPAVTNADILLF